MVVLSIYRSDKNNCHASYKMFTVLFDILKFLKLIQCIVWQKKNYFVQTEFVFKTIVGYKKNGIFSLFLLWTSSWAYSQFFYLYFFAKIMLKVVQSRLFNLRQLAKVKPYLPANLSSAGWTTATPCILAWTNPPFIISS